MASRAIDNREPLATGASPLEEAARAAMGERRSGPLTDAEWALARSRLLAFGKLLRAWDQEREPSRPAEVIPLRKQP